MLKLQVIRPNTIGVTMEREYECYAGECEEFVERHVERLSDRGWDASESAESTSECGSIELTNDNEADVILILWQTMPETEDL